MGSFDDLLADNVVYSEAFRLQGFDGIARKGVALITCMDSRLEPLEMVGLAVGDAKILRTPGGHLTEDALIGCIMGVHRLGVDRIMVIEHTNCAMGSSTEEQTRQQFLDEGIDPGDIVFGPDPNQLERVKADVQLLRDHPMLTGRVTIGGFMYDVETGLLEEVC